MQRTGRCIRLGCIIVLGSIAATAADIDGQLSLTLEDAVWQDGKGRSGEPTYLILDFVVRDGRWERDVYGWAWNLNRSDHFGTLRKVGVDGGRITLDVHMEIDGDPWIPGGLVDYRIELSLKDGKATGTHSGTFRGKAMKGTVTGELAPLPKPREGYAPPAIGEHPRLLIRKSDVAELKKRAETEWGRALIDRIKAKTDSGLCMGLMFALTGEQGYADLCRAVIEKEIPDKTGGPWNLGHEHGRRQQRVAITLDLAWDGLDEQFRALVAGYLWYYHSRLSLRPTTFSKKTNQAPGSNYMAFIVCGGISTQMAVWDAPGAFPVEPAEPRMERLSGPAEVTMGEGVPAATVVPGKAIDKWLFAGPFYALKDRESHLVLREQEKGKPRYQHWGQDFLAGIGGVKAQVRAGTKAVYKGRACTFDPLDTGGKPIDVWVTHKNVPCSAGYYYTVLRVPKAGWYTVRLEAGAQIAKQANPCMGNVSEKFTYDLAPFRLDATLYLAGEAFHEGDAVHLNAQPYPAMLRATTRQYQIRLLPRLEATTEAEAKASLAARSERFDKHNTLWEHYAEAYYRRPMVRICRRKALRYDLFAQGTAGYKNEAGSYHNYTMGWTPLLNHTYASYHGVPMPNNAMALPCWTMTGEGNPEHFAKGFATVPDALKPAVLWAWEQRKRGRDGERSDPLMTFLNYPVGLEPKGPMGVLPNPYLDRRQGWCAFRSGWGANDLMAEIYFKSPPPTGWNRACAGSFSIRGFGRTWAWRGDGRSGERYLEENVILFPGDAAWVNGPGRVTYFEGKPDGSGVVSGSLDDALLDIAMGEDGKPKRARDYGGRLERENLRNLGLRNLRSFGVDYSGTCGAPGLFVVADRTRGGKRKYWQFLLPAGKQGEAAARVVGRKFTIRQADASLAGAVIAPAGARLRLVEPGTEVEAVDGRGRKQSRKLEHQAIWVEGGDDFLVVMTLQRGAPPKVAVEGDGLGAKITVGKRTVRFDGQKIVFGD